MSERPAEKAAEAPLLAALPPPESLGSPGPGSSPAGDANAASRAGVEMDEREARRFDLTWSVGMLGAVAGLFVLLSLFRGVAVPVLLSLATAYVLNPAVTFLEKRGYSRTAGTTGLFVTIGLAVVGAGFYLVPLFRAEAEKLPDLLRAGGSQLVPRVEQLLGISLPELVRARAEELSNEVSSLLKSAGPAMAKLLASFAGNTARFVATLLGLLVVLVLAFFFLKDYPRLIHLGAMLIPRRALPLLGKRFAEIDGVLSAFVRGQLTVGAILSVLYSAGLSAARIDMAIVIGCIAGFGNMVPFVGTALGVSLAMLTLVLSWQGPWQVVVIIGTFVVAQAAEATVITPKVVGDKVGLPTVAVIVAVLAFGELFGFVGVLLAVPTAAVLKVVLRVVVERYRKTRLYTGEVAER